MTMFFAGFVCGVAVLVGVGAILAMGDDPDLDVGRDTSDWDGLR